MTYSLHNADQAICLKIVTLGLLGAIVVALIGLNTKIAHSTKAPVLRGSDISVIHTETSRFQ